jgi:hypothetical protein
MAQHSFYAYISANLGRDPRRQADDGNPDARERGRIPREKLPRLYRAEDRSIRSTGGRNWWAHLKFTPINIKRIILPQEDRGFARGANGTAKGP